MIRQPYIVYGGGMSEQLIHPTRNYRKRGCLKGRCTGTNIIESVRLNHESTVSDTANMPLNRV